MRAWHCLLLLAAAQPAFAGEPEPPYYGPQKSFWEGGYGYRDKVEHDGTLRVDAFARGDHALDIAMYRAAELARASGAEYVQLLGASGGSFRIDYSATVYLKPAADPAPPTLCRSKRRGSCYTAEVAELLRVLGGPNGAQPGVPVIDHYDEHGRAVTVSGFGIAAAGSAPRRLVAPSPPPRYLPPAPPADARMSRSASAVVSTATQARALKAQAGVRGREPQQGWTISD